MAAIVRCLQMPEDRVPRRCEEASWGGFDAEQFRALPETLEHEVGAEYRALGSRLIRCPHLHLMPPAYRHTLRLVAVQAGMGGWVFRAQVVFQYSLGFIRAY